MKPYLFVTLISLGLGVCIPEKSAQAQTILQAKHGLQGTGNYKRKKDWHEKPGPKMKRKRNQANG